MIELARYFKARGKPERTLMFAAFTAEEIGFLGSEYFARQLDCSEVVAMFSIAAIGKVDPRGPNTAIVTGFDRSDFGKIIQQAVEGTPYSFYPDPYVRQNLFRRSDNAPFARRGVPAHAISTISMDPRDKDLHRVSDEVETLDLNNMTSLIRAIALGAAPIISGKATPTRIDPPLDKSP
jgi:Zn-dependent M28 family amino/carboxypeptidase